MMKEQVLIARRLWTGESVEWKSDRYTFTDVDLKPQPLFPVPVWWGGATPAGSASAVQGSNRQSMITRPADTKHLRRWLRA